MGDASHVYGADLDLSAGGDLLYVSGDTETQQKVIKRLLTPLGADIWNLTYGAGLGQFVGQPLDLTALQNAVRAQIFQEASVAQLPEPTVSATSNPDGTVLMNIAYVDAATGRSQTFSFSVGQ